MDNMICNVTANRQANFLPLATIHYANIQLLILVRSMKRYFFLDQSDYFTHFLDLASAELKRPSKEVSLNKLQSLMDLALRNPSSVTVNDIFKEDLKVDLSHLSLVDQLLRIIHVGGLGQGQALQDQGQGQILGNERVDSRASSYKIRSHSRAGSGIHQQQGSNDSWHDENVVEGRDNGTKSGISTGGLSSMDGIMMSTAELPTQSRGPLAGKLRLYRVKFISITASFVDAKLFTNCYLCMA